MPKTPVTELVRKDRYNLLGLTLLNKGIVNDDMLLPRHSEEVCVAVRTSLTSINDVELVKRELQPFSQCFDTCLEVSRFKW